MQIRITRRIDVSVEPDHRGLARSVTLNEGHLLDARQITEPGNAIVDMGDDYGWTAIPESAWERVTAEIPYCEDCGDSPDVDCRAEPEHYTTLMITGGENHVECTCGWSQPENKDHPEPILALRKLGMTHVRYTEAIR